MIWFTIGCVLLISFIFSGIEAGILSVNRVRLRHHVKLGDRAAVRLDRLLARPGRLLGTVLLVTNLMNIWAVALISQELVKTLGTPFGYALTFAICLPLLVLGVELFPKSLFRRFPYRALAVFADLLRVTDLLLSPLLSLAGWFGKRVRTEETASRKLFAGREDFKYWTIESERVGALSSDERAMIHNVVDFRGVTARELMVPLEHMPSVPASCSIEELLFLGHKLNADQFVVRDETGTITGQVNVFDVLLDRDASQRVSFYQRRMVRVAPEEAAYNVIRKLRAARTKLAAVEDATGRTLGIVREQDLILRLVSVATAPTPHPAAETPNSHQAAAPR